MGFRDNFKKGTIEMMILALLSESDLYGYQLSQLIAERSNHAIEILEGTMYPTLHRLVDNGYISDKRVQVGKRMSRVYYHLEPNGRDRLCEMVSEYRIFTDGLENILSFCNFSSEVDET